MSAIEETRARLKRGEPVSPHDELCVGVYDLAKEVGRIKIGMKDLSEEIGELKSLLRRAADVIEMFHDTEKRTDESERVLKLIRDRPALSTLPELDAEMGEG